MGMAQAQQRIGNELGNKKAAVVLVAQRGKLLKYAGDNWIHCLRLTPCLRRRAALYPLSRRRQDAETPREHVRIPGAAGAVTVTIYDPPPTHRGRLRNGDGHRCGSRGSVIVIVIVAHLPEFLHASRFCPVLESALHGAML